MRRIAPLSGLGLFVCSLIMSQGCNRVSLHRSFGQRYRDMNVAQQSAHPAHDVTMRGAEADLIVQTYTDGFTAVPDSTTPSSGGAAGGSKKTAGVPPLH